MRDYYKELDLQVDKNINDIINPFLRSFGFLQDKTSNLIFVKRNCQIIFHIWGFHPHDIPWSIDVELKKIDNSIYLRHYKEKIALFEGWQKEVLERNSESYLIYTIESIDKSFTRIKNDLEKFCADFLNEDYKRFNYAIKIHQ